MSELSNVRGDWAYLRHELKRRTFEPAAHFPFVVYVVVAVIGYGGLGIWAEIVKGAEKSNLITAVITFFPALVGSTAYQLILASPNNKVLTSFAQLMSFILLGCAILLAIFTTSCPIGALWAGILSSTIAIWMWWFTNADDPTFRRSPPPDAATGGNTDRVLTGDTGDIKV